MLGIPLSVSLSGKEIRIANRKYEMGVNCGPTCSKMVSPRSQAKENEYTPEERAKMPLKTACARLLDTSLSL